ncbi:hypothetical protein C8R46DRAFT_1028905 [Mycena filopes]|nr:hypothetical protein C8R46DRAFT_1028905 [Mycena filopes]
MGKSSKDTVVSQDSPKVSKPKREKRRRDEPAAEDELDSVPNSTEPPKKKPRKNKTGFPDPEEDTSGSLSEQATKGCTSVVLRLYSVSKTLQVEVLQGTAKLIPDTYVPLTVQYLSNVQGGVRETLIKECHTLLAVPSAPEIPPSTVSPTHAVSTEIETEAIRVKQIRARALLDALEAPPSEPSK